jgi:RNA polymerase sigma-70 factor (ECF subfamily)
MTKLNVTQLLLDWSNGDKSALDRLTPLIYDELHRLANFYMRKQSPGHTLQATALVNEIYIKLINTKNVNWKDRAHFFAVAAQAMRQILIDHARSHKYAKRGGDARKVELDEVAIIAQEQAAILIALDDALKSLSVIDQRKSQIVELRFFGGLSIEETAEVMKISTPTVEREWRLAKAWLYRELSQMPE